MSKDHVFEGKATGGPLKGQNVCNNAVKGFVLISEDFSKIWVYDYESGKFNSQHEGPLALDEDKLVKAQEDGGRSVRILSDPEEAE